MEDCVDGDYLGAYRRYLEDFVARVDPDDQLPVKTNGYDVTEDELVGEIVNMTLQYLHQKSCPVSLQVHIVQTVIEEIESLCEKQPEICGLREDKRAYAPLKLMQAVTGKVNDICRRYLDSSSRLALLPPPYSMPLPLTSSCSIKHTRRKMEDRYTILHDLNAMFNVKDDSVANYYAIFDGHAGQDAAVYSASHLHQYLVESAHYPKDPESALRDAFRKTDEKFLEKDEELKSRSGTTAVCTLLMNQILYVAWAGDSQAVLAKNYKTVDLVNPHRASRNDEKDRIEQMKGVVLEYRKVWRVNGQLSITRAIGDKQHKPFVTAEPGIVSVPLDGSEDFLILGCDGLFDVVTSSEAINLVYEYLRSHPAEKYDEAAQYLVNSAKVNHSLDNITVIVVYLRPPAEIVASVRSITANQKHLKMSAADEDVNFLKEDFDPLRCSMSSSEQKNLIFQKSSNGQHENGGGEIEEEDEDEDDLGPETDVDAVDEVHGSFRANDSIVMNRDLFQQKLEENGDEEALQEKNERSGEHELIPETDNVADSEDSEDEWNYYRVEGKTLADSEAKAGKVRTKSSCEENVNIEFQSEAAAVELDKSEDGGKAETSELIDQVISAEEKLAGEEKCKAEGEAEDYDKDNMSHHWNPDAEEFVPISTSRPSFPERVNLSPDYPISGSPLKRTPKEVNDIAVPNETDFNREISQRPRELGGDDSFGEIQANNGEACPENTMDSTAADSDEVSSTKAELGDISLFKDDDFHQSAVSTVALEEAFLASERNDYDIAKDPMAMSFTPGDFEAAFEKEVDMNAVHELRDSDLLGTDEVIKNMINEKESAQSAFDAEESDELCELNPKMSDDFIVAPNAKSEDEDSALVADTIVPSDDIPVSVDQQRTMCDDRTPDNDNYAHQELHEKDEPKSSFADFMMHSESEPEETQAYVGECPLNKEDYQERNLMEKDDDTSVVESTLIDTKNIESNGDTTKTNENYSNLMDLPANVSSQLNDNNPFKFDSVPLMPTVCEKQIVDEITEQLGAHLNMHDTTAEFEEKEAEVLKEDLMLELKEEVEEHVIENVPESKDLLLEMEKPESAKVEDDVSVVKEMIKDEEAKDDVIETALVASAAAAAVAVAAAAGASKSATKIKPASAKTTKSTKMQPATATSKTGVKSSPTSPLKTTSGSVRTTASPSTAIKKPATSSTSAPRPKQLDMKLSANKPTTLKAPVSKTASSTTTTAAKTTTSSRLTSATTKAKTLTKTSAVEKKPPVTNGEAKTASKSSTVQVKTTAIKAASRTSALVKTTTATSARTTTTATKTKSTSATNTSTVNKSNTRVTAASTLTNTTAARPKTAPATTTSTLKTRVSAQNKAPMMDKQVKESANKQISSARSSASAKTTMTATTRTVIGATAITKRTGNSTTTSTNVKASLPIKRPLTATKPGAIKTTTAAKTNVKSTITKTKIVENGICEIEKTEKIESLTIAEEDVPIKDVSPIAPPTDNQLITSTE